MKPEGHTLAFLACRSAETSSAVSVGNPGNAPAISAILDMGSCFFRPVSGATTPEGEGISSPFVLNHLWLALHAYGYRRAPPPANLRNPGRVGELT